jgi:predicted nucleotidyltransferase
VRKRVFPNALPAHHPAHALASALTGFADVRWAYLFGSAARSEAFRDLDVAVMLANEARGAVALGRISAALESGAAGKQIDLVDLREAAPALAGRIAREGIPIVDRDPDGRKLWEIEANLRALDIEPWLRQFEDLRARALLRRVG